MKSKAAYAELRNLSLAAPHGGSENPGVAWTRPYPAWPRRMPIRSV